MMRAFGFLCNFFLGQQNTENVINRENKNGQQWARTKRNYNTNLRSSFFFRIEMFFYHDGLWHMLFYKDRKCTQILVDEQLFIFLNEIVSPKRKGLLLVVCFIYFHIFNQFDRVDWVIQILFQDFESTQCSYCEMICYSISELIEYSLNTFYFNGHGVLHCVT